MLTRSKHELHNDFHSSLEEAAVSRPDRKVGSKIGQPARAPKVRHIGHGRIGDGYDLFTASETRRTARRWVSYWGGVVNQSFDSEVPALRASVSPVIRDHALTRVATDFRRFAPGLLPSR